MSNYVIVDYFDVIGNEVYGWEVNNLCKRDDFGIITITDEASDEDMFNYLKEIGFIAEGVSFEDIEISGDDCMIEFSIASNGYPCFRLEKVN